LAESLPRATQALAQQLRPFKQGPDDGNAETLSFIASPEIVTAFAIAGRLDFNPLKDKIRTDDGQEVMLTPPHAEEMPLMGYAGGETGFTGPLPDAERKKIDVIVSPTSERLQKLTPFAAWDGKDFKI